MTPPLQPHFFVTRPNNLMVPLIALDELPPNVSLRGVSRFLKANETYGMTSMGEYPHPRTHYQLVDNVSTGRATPTGAGQRHPNEHELLASWNYAGPDDTPEGYRQVAHAYSQQAASQTWGMHAPTTTGWSASTATVPSAPTGPSGANNKINVNPKKIYCSYWIRHGECDYAQQGCLYKHEMPKDLSMLEKLGLRDIPKWYREKYGIPSIHGHRTQMRSGQHSKGDGAARTAEKNIQHPPRLLIEASGNVQSDLPFRNAQNYAPAQRIATPVQTRAYVPQGYMRQMQGQMNASHNQASNMQPADILTSSPQQYSVKPNAGNFDQRAYPSPEGDHDSASQDQIAYSMQSLGIDSMGQTQETLIDLTPCPNPAKRVSRIYFPRTQTPNSVFAGREGANNAPTMTRAQSSFSGWPSYHSEANTYKPRPIGERTMSSVPASRKTSPESGGQSSSPSSSDQSAHEEVKTKRRSHATIACSGALKERGDIVDHQFVNIC
ncbi:hypothetical protein PHISCL_04038 [Aspergillus sclerotialis]|uniref:C3H1-type domain-containing protein n=1 Tax=Aspergillus sclerotialis TaxID=2070753 RepID=A0A3A2ZWE1_9EURO|nr:hypothetical protein PHISCL_04038 [Aspergillus sclerotialis]